MSKEIIGYIVRYTAEHGGNAVFDGKTKPYRWAPKHRKEAHMVARQLTVYGRPARVIRIVRTARMRSFLVTTKNMKTHLMQCVDLPRSIRHGAHVIVELRPGMGWPEDGSSVVKVVKNMSDSLPHKLPVHDYLDWLAKRSQQSCTYCQGKGFYPDVLSGDETYCDCPKGKTLKEVEECKS